MIRGAGCSSDRSGQYSHEPNIAVVRIRHFAGLLEQNAAGLPARTGAGYRALEVMEQHLRDRKGFVGNGYPIADISRYACTHAAGEGGFDPGRFENVRAWLKRVRRQPGHVTLAGGAPG